MKSPLPKSKAKTAYGLLSDVCRVVLDEPRRLRMCVGLVDDISVMDSLGDQAPECGTVGCVAGWTSVLIGRTDRNVISTARDVLGLSPIQEDELFYQWDTSTEDGTPEHAKQEVRLIRKFQKKYAKQLKAKRV